MNHPPTLLATMRAHAQQVRAALRAQPGCHALNLPPLPPVPPHIRWHNALFAAAGFRRAHVELLEVPDHFAVLHVCVHPHTTSSAPIFGFDMISGQNQATGIFLDFSPVTAAAPTPALGQVISAAQRAAFATPRARPPWGSIFSEDFFAVRPADMAEVMVALDLANTALTFFLPRLQPFAAARPRAPHQDWATVQGQRAYALAQRQNPHTQRVLAKYVGPEAARAFIENVLFPLPCAAAPSVHALVAPSA